MRRRCTVSASTPTTSLLLIWLIVPASDTLSSSMVVPLTMISSLTLVFASEKSNTPSTATLGFLRYLG